MKLRLRIQHQTIRTELEGEDLTLKQLVDHVKDLVRSQGLSSETDFGLSLNGSELLSDTGQTLSSCGIVSGDLLSVVLPESAASSTSSSSSTTIKKQSKEQHQQTAAMASNQQPIPETDSSSRASDLPGSNAVVSRWEPVLCSEAQEGEAPLSLEQLYLSAQISSPSDAILVAGHLLMLETGFVPEGGQLSAAEMPEGWRATGGVYKLRYSHPLCEHSLAMVVAVTMGGVLVINATLKINHDVDRVRKLCLRPSSYLTDEWPGESAAAAFKGLNELSRVFKDQLAYPLIAAAREAMSLPVAFGLAVLPQELFVRVARLLDVRSVVRLSAVCRHLNAAASDSTLWSHLYQRDFKESRDKPSDTNWKELYRHAHKLRFNLQRFCHSHPTHPVLTPYPLPILPRVPGIIGGEYDQRPNLLLPRPRYDPIGPLPNVDQRPLFRHNNTTGGRASNIRRGLI
ncbi:uncharacterized protein V6R79_019646 [Siganus canaliculatus]